MKRRRLDPSPVNVHAAPPPAELARLVEAVGVEAALTIVEKHGGTRLYVARQITSETTIVVELGRPAADRLVKAMGGEVIKVPLVRSWRIRLYRLSGWSYSNIARHLGCSEDAVSLELQRSNMTHNSRQAELPL